MSPHQCPARRMEPSTGLSPSARSMCPLALSPLASQQWTLGFHMLNMPLGLSIQTQTCSE